MKSLKKFQNKLDKIIQKLEKISGETTENGIEEMTTLFSSVKEANGTKENHNIKLIKEILNIKL